VSTISAAIKKGAPLYNQGDFDGCYQSYLAGANKVVAANAYGTDQLKIAIEKSSKESSKDGAWTLRYAFDSIMRSAQTAPTPAITPTFANPLITIPTFATPVITTPTFGSVVTVRSSSTTGFEIDPTQQTWEAVNDSVMGGVSFSTVVKKGAVGSRYLDFTGYATTASNGGFASARSYGFQPRDFSMCKGIQIEVKGDGLRYGFEIRNSQNQWRSPTYEYAFNAPRGWTTVDIPFSSMVSTWMGQTNFGDSLTNKLVTSFGLKRSAFTGGGKDSTFTTGNFSVQLRKIRCLL